MTARQPLGPKFGSNQVLTATSTSQTATIGTGEKQVRIVNTGSNKGYIKTFRLADGPATASAADFVIPASMASTITKPQDHDSLAYFSASGTTLEAMTGEGF